MQAQAALQRIADLRELNIFISVNHAACDDAQLVAVKDCIDVEGMVTTAGGVILDNPPAESDAPVVAAIRASGCTVIGKTNMHEFAFGVTNVNPHYGSIPNPVDSQRIVGGSSGGSAAAVAYGMCDWAVGSDTGGSIRIPASLCGVVGIKPSARSIESNVGVIALSPSLDTLGSLGVDVSAAAQGIGIMRGDHAPDAVPDTAMAACRLAVPRRWVANLDEPTRLAWATVSAGLREIDFPPREPIARACHIILFSEAAKYHRAWIQGRPNDYGPDVLASLKLGQRVPSREYADALAARSYWSSSVEAALNGWDAILLPTTACVAPLRSESNAAREELLRFTQPFNVTGHPVVSIPAPVPRNSLPVGVQVVGHLNEDAKTISIASALEAAWRCGHYC